MTATRRRVTLLGLLLVGLGVSFRAWSQRGVWYFFDDFNFVRLAATHDLDRTYLTTPYNGHLMPGGNLLTWLNHHLAPMDFRLPAAEMLAMFAVAALGMLRLGLTLFGPRAGALVPLCFLCFTPILIPATTWWAAGMNYLPALVATVWALEAHVRYLRSPAPRRLVAPVLWILVGLAFAELTLFAYLFLAHVTLAYFTSGRFPDRIRQLLRDHRAATLLHLALIGAYLAAYVPTAMNFRAGEVTQRPLFDVARDLVGTAFSAAVVGGPGRWRLSGVTQSAAHPSDLTLVLGWTVLVVLIWTSLSTRRRGLRAWLLPALVLAASVALVSISRAIYFGPQIALDYRFQTMAAPALGLALTLAFLPVLGAVESAETRRVGWLADHPLRVTVAMALVAGFATLSTARYPMRDLGPHSPHAYVQRLWASSSELPDSAVLIDLTVPPWLWRGLDSTSNRYSRVFASWEARVPPAREVVVDEGYLVDDSGTVAPIAMDVVRRSQPSFQVGCPYPVRSAGVSVPLDGPVIGFVWFARVHVTSSAPTRLTIQVDTDRWTSEVPSGTHTVLVPGAGRYDRLGVSSSIVAAQTGSGVTCVTSVEVGTLGPGG